MKKMRKEKHIAVIGAGMAGLSVADALVKMGYEVTVFEARSRVGGRVDTCYDLAPYPVEFGAEFIHGHKAKTWAYVKRFELNQTTPLFEKEEHFGLFKEGRMLRYPENDALPGWDVLERLERIMFSPNKDMSLEEYLNVPIEPWMNHVVAPDYGADMKDLGIKGYLEASYIGEGTGDFRLNQGYTALAKALAKSLTIRLEHPVQDITRDARVVTLTFENGTKSTHDAVVVTVPLGVLKAQKIRFTPALPVVHQNAIHAIGSGNVNKVILRFKEAFWPHDLEGFYTDLPTQIWWRPGFSKTEEVPILTALVGGDMGTKLSSMTEEEAFAWALEDLETMFPKASVTTLFEKGYFVNWGADPYALMGYSYNAVGSYKQRQALAKPVGATLFFAGEATHHIYPATVHGAILSGLRAAKQVHKMVK